MVTWAQGCDGSMVSLCATHTNPDTVSHLEVESAGCPPSPPQVCFLLPTAPGCSVKTIFPISHAGYGHVPIHHVMSSDGTGTLCITWLKGDPLPRPSVLSLSQWLDFCYSADKCPGGSTAKWKGLCGGTLRR